MENIIEIKNLYYAYKNNKVYENFSLKIEKSSWVSILGANGAGKTTLVRLMLGLLKNNDSITVDNLIMNRKNLRNIRKSIGVVFDNTEVQFVSETVKDEIAFTLENLQYTNFEIKERVLEIAHMLKINTLLDVEPHRLSGGQMQKVALACALAIKPKILILDEALSMIDPYDKEEIMKVISKYHKENETTIINFTSDIEETIKSERIIGLIGGKIGLDGKMLEVLSSERAMKNLGLELPFIVELANKLKLYGITDKVELDMEQLVNNIWK